MDTRLDFQRLLEDMDKVIQAKQQELDELDTRLEVARTQLSDLEANELAKQAVKVQQDAQNSGKQQQSTATATTTSEPASKISGQQHNLIHQQRQIYEQQLKKFNDELAELESINQELVRDNKSLAARLNKSLRNNEDLQVKTSSLADKLEEALNANLELNLSLGRAQAEIKAQERLLRKTHDEDEVLMRAFGDKLESLKRTLDERDEEIKRLRSDNQFALNSFAMIIGNNEDKKTRGHQQTDDFISSKINDYEGQVDSDTTTTQQRVIRLVEAFQEKNHEVEQLKRQLLQATKDLEEKAALFESLNLKETDRLDDEAGESDEQSIGHLKAVSGGMNELLARYEMLESELEVKGRQLHLSEFKNNHYETILPPMIADLIQALLANLRKGSASNTPTLSNEKIKALLSGLENLGDRLSATKELLRKIDWLKSVNYEKDARIEELVKELNELYETGTGRVLNPSDESLKAKTSLVKLEKLQLGSTNKTEASSDGNTIDNNLPSQQSLQVRLQSRDSGSANVSSEGDGQLVQQSMQRQPSASQNCESDKPSPEQVFSYNESEEAVSQQQSSEEMQVQANENKLDRQKSKTTMTSGCSRPLHSTNDTSDLNIALTAARGRLKLLESENELLELAMKEILLSLKWSDAQCNTLLIDCPSLERLCQLIEARFLAHLQDGQSSESAPADDGGIGSKILFQLVILKSELDLLRGQNEELRSNAKAEFRERMNQLKHLNSEKAISTLAEQVELKVSQACQTDSLPEPAAEIKCKNCSKLTNLAKHLLQCIMRVETRLRVSDEIYTSRLLGLHQVIQILEKELSNCECQLDETRRELNHQNQRKLSTDVRLQYIQDQLSFHMKFCSMSRINSSHPRVGAENLQIYTAAKSGNGDSIESYTISQKTASHPVTHNDTKIRDPRLTISMLQSIISCLQSRIDFKDARLKELEQLLSSVTTNYTNDASRRLVQDNQQETETVD